MNAYQFVKTEGLEKAKAVVDGAHWENIAYSNGSYYSQSCGKNDVRLDDLKQAIADFEIVGSTDLREIEEVMRHLPAGIPDSWRFCESYQQIKQGISA